MMHGSNYLQNQYCDTLACDRIIDYKKQSPVYIPDDLYKRRIITELGVADECSVTQLKDYIDVIWMLAQGQSPCDNYVVYLLSKMQSLQFLMGCYSKLVDTRDVRAERHQKVNENRKGFQRASSQSTAQSTSFSDSIGKSRFEDFSFADGDSGSKRTARATSYSDSYSKMDNTGFSDSKADSSSRRNASGGRTTTNESNGHGIVEGSGQSGSCNYSFSRSGSSGGGANIASWGTDGTESRNFSVKEQKSSGFNWETSLNSLSSDRHNHGFSKSDAHSERTHSSYNQAIMDAYNTNVGGSSAFDDSESFRVAKAHAEGFGTGQAEGRSATQSSSQGTSDAEQHEVHARQGVINGINMLDDVKYSQRFNNLNQMYKQVLKDIDFYLKTKSANSGAAAAKMLTKWRDCCCVAGNLATITTPCNTSSCSGYNKI